MAVRGNKRKESARSKVMVSLPEHPAGKFYAGEKKKPGPKRNLLKVSIRATPNAIQNPRKSYTINYKLWVLSWLRVLASIPSGPSKFREPTFQEAATRFKIPLGNLGRWQKEEREGNYLEGSAMSRRLIGGGRRRKCHWVDMERKLYESFRQCRAKGKVVHRSWFCQNAKQLYKETYPGMSISQFRFSNR